jgi:hypothetical protein
MRSSALGYKGQYPGKASESRNMGKYAKPGDGPDVTSFSCIIVVTYSLHTLEEWGRVFERHAFRSSAEIAFPLARRSGISRPRAVTFSTDSMSPFRTTRASLKLLTVVQTCRGKR